MTAGTPMRRLTGHFFRAMFDFGILTQTGADSFKHMLLGVMGGVIAFGLALTRIFFEKYAAIAGSATSLPYQRALLGDDSLIIGLPMLLLAFVTLMASGSLFPDERDFRILCPLPVRKNVIFGAKMAALLLFSGLVIAAVHVALIPMMVLTSVNPWQEHAVPVRMFAWVVASASASVSVVFAIAGVVGLLALTAPRGRLHLLTALFKSSVFVALILCVPFLLRATSFGGPLSEGAGWTAFFPPAWFVGLERVLLGSADPWMKRLAVIGLTMFGAAVAVVVAAYAALFRNFERLALRSSTTSSVRFGTSPARFASSATPPFRAVYFFTTTTLWRSHLHQSVLVGLFACGLAIAINRFSGVDFANASRTSASELHTSLASAAMWVPFALMFVSGIGIRATLALPMKHSANWIFRLTESPAARREQLRAVERIVTVCVVGIPLALGLPFLWLALGVDSVMAACVIAPLGLVAVHGVLLDWHRIPFTCSYLPGKSFPLQTLLIGVGAFMLVTLGGRALVRWAISGSAWQVLLISGLLFATARLLKRKRLATWERTPLMFEDQFVDRPMQLLLDNPLVHRGPTLSVSQAQPDGLRVQRLDHGG